MQRFRSEVALLTIVASHLLYGLFTAFVRALSRLRSTIMVWKGHPQFLAFCQAVKDLFLLYLLVRSRRTELLARLQLLDSFRYLGIRRVRSLCLRWTLCDRFSLFLLYSITSILQFFQWRIQVCFGLLESLTELFLNIVSDALVSGEDLIFFVIFDHDLLSNLMS